MEPLGYCLSLSLHPLGSKYKRAQKRYILWLPYRSLSHVYEFLRIIRRTHLGFEQLYILKLNQNAIKVLSRLSDLLLKRPRGLGPRYYVDVCSSAAPKHPKALNVGFGLQTRKSAPEIHRFQILEANRQ
jgi:hypothetical protein